VTWYDAWVFGKWLGADYRLPTEAEWEYACRAGTKTTCHCGDTIADARRAGWYGEDSGLRTHSVGQKAPNAWSLYDMHGNVSEWCLDWYGEYPSGRLVDPLGPALGEYRVNRGGNFRVSTFISRTGASVRSAVSPWTYAIILGFRVIRSSPRR